MKQRRRVVPLQELGPTHILHRVDFVNSCHGRTTIIALSWCPLQRAFGRTFLKNEAERHNGRDWCGEAVMTASMAAILGWRWLDGQGDSCIGKLQAAAVFHPELIQRQVRQRDVTLTRRSPSCLRRKALSRFGFGRGARWKRGVELSVFWHFWTNSVGCRHQEHRRTHSDGRNDEFRTAPNEHRGQEWR